MPQQVIYNPQAYRAPRSEGRALQALSQFGQQAQYRKTFDLQQAQKRQDDFIELLKIDNVYAATSMIKEQMSSGIKDYMDTATNEYAKADREGYPVDLAKVAQRRAALNANLDRLKSMDDGISEGAKGVQMGMVDPRGYEEGLAYTIKTGLEPVGGYSPPIVIDPMLLYMNTFDENKPKDISGTSYTQNPLTGKWSWTKTTGSGLDKAGESQYENETLFRTVKNPLNQYSIGTSYDRAIEDGVISQQDVARYKQQAQSEGMPEEAVWMREDISKLNYGWSTQTVYGTSKPPYSATIPVGENVYETSPDMTKVGNFKTQKFDMFYEPNINPTMMSPQGGIKFQNDISTKPIKIDVGNIKFNRDVYTGDKDRVNAMAAYGGIDEEGDKAIEIDIKDNFDVQMVVPFEEYYKDPNLQQYKHKTLIDWSKDEKGSGLINWFKNLRKEEEDMSIYQVVTIPIGNLVGLTKYNDVVGDFDSNYNNQLRPMMDKWVTEELKW